MTKIEAVIFKEYFIKSLEKLENNIQNLFYKKIEILEDKDRISKKLHYGHKIELRCFRISKFRFIFVLEENKAVFLDVMYREIDYKYNYMDKLFEIYKHGN